MTNDFVQRLTVVLHSHWRHFRKVDMIMALTQERKNEIIKEYARHEGDTGSAEVQIAVLTADINELNVHMAAHKHDLMKKIGSRRNLLRYLRNTDIQRYRELIQRLGLRR